MLPPLIDMTFKFGMGCLTYWLVSLTGAPLGVVVSATAVMVTSSWLRISFR